MKKSIVLLLSVFFCYSFSQEKKIGSIRGKVLDKNDEGIGFATVSVAEKNTGKVLVGVMTDYDGNFEINEVPVGTFLLKVDYVEYKPFTYGSPIVISESKYNIILPDIKLEENVETLEGVTLTGESTSIVNKIDRKVVNVGKDLTVVGADASFVMSHIPSVAIDPEGNLSLRGNQNVVILVDGKQSNLESKELLETLPAEAIDKIEIINNPSSKYSPEGTSGIINIITKREKLSGITGGITGGIGTNGEYNGGASINLNKNKLSLSANYNYSHKKRYGNIFKSTEIISSENFFNESSKESSQDDDRHHLKLGIDYFATKKHRISYNFGINGGKRSTFEEINYNFLDSNRDTTNTSYRNTKGNNDRLSHNHNINFKQEFDTSDHYLEIDLFADFRNDDGHNNYINKDSLLLYPNATEELERDFSTKDNKMFVVSVDYSKNDDIYGKIDAGTKITKRNMKDSQSYEALDENGNFVPVENRSTDFVYDEETYAFYGVYSNKLENLFDYQIGLRLEQTMLEVKSLTIDSSSTNNYLSWFPSVHLVKKITEFDEIALNYSKRISRPRGWNLNPTPIYSDEWNIITGNPYLNPEFTHSIEFSYLRTWSTGSISSAIFSRYSTDIIRRLFSTDQNGINTISWGNLGTSQDFGYELTLQNKFFKLWTLMANFNAYYVKLEGESDSFSNSGIDWNLRLNNNIVLPKDMSIQVNMFYNGEKTLSQGYLDPFSRIDLGLQKSFFNRKLSIGIRASDVLNTLKFKVHNHQENSFNSIVDMNFETRVVYFTLSYKFGIDNNRKNKGKKMGDKNNEDMNGNNNENMQYE